jgi:hypothetical protein
VGYSGGVYKYRMRSDVIIGGWNPFGLILGGFGLCEAGTPPGVLNATCGTVSGDESRKKATAGCCMWLSDSVVAKGGKS